MQTPSELYQDPERGARDKAIVSACLMASRRLFDIMEEVEEAAWKAGAIGNNEGEAKEAWIRIVAMHFADALR